MKNEARIVLTSLFRGSSTEEGTAGSAHKAEAATSDWGRHTEAPSGPGTRSL